MIKFRRHWMAPLIIALCSLQPKVHAQSTENSGLENIKGELLRLQHTLPFRNSYTDSVFDNLYSELARTEHKNARQFQNLKDQISALRGNSDINNDSDTGNPIDAVFFTLLDDSDTQAQTLEKAITVAESNKFVTLRISALTVLAMNGIDARDYTARILELATEQNPFQVRYFAIFALGEIHPTADGSQALFSELISRRGEYSQEDRALVGAAISALGKGREKNGDLAPLVIEIIRSTEDASLINAAARALAELSSLPDESIAALYKQSNRLDTKVSTLESTAKLARLARDCSSLNFLKNANISSKLLINYSDLGPLYADGIKNLDDKCLDNESALSRAVIETWRWFLALETLNQIILIISLLIVSRVAYILIQAVVFPENLAEKAFYMLATRPSEGTHQETIKETIKRIITDHGPLALQGLVIPWFVLRSLGSSQYITTRWIKKYRTQLYNNAFQLRSSVANRSRYLDISGLDGHIQRSRHRDIIWIHGAGGSGKSTLAFRMAATLAHESGKPLIPVVIDDEWAPNLLAFVASNFRADHSHPKVPESILRKLIQSGKILLIFDGISERSSAKLPPSQFTRQLFTDLEFRKCIFTSRDEEPLLDSYHIELGPISGDKLDIFARGLVKAENLPNFLRSIEPLRGSEPISPLFVDLAAQQFNTGQSIPSSYPDLVSSCVSVVDPGPDITRVDFLEAARVSAYICIDKGNHLPRAMSRTDFEIYFDALTGTGSITFQGEVSADRALAVLTATGLMRSDTTLARKRWSFSNDPFCEYLAALFIAETKTWYREGACRNPALVIAVKESLEAARKRGVTPRNQTVESSSAKKRRNKNVS